MPVERRKSRQVRVGKVTVGGDAPVRVQSMTITKTANVDATLQQIASLVASGCEIVRVAVPHWEDAEALTAIAAKSTIPVVADIHFQWKYAMAALEAGVHGLRINPGNIKYQDKVRLIAREAKARGVPIRIGVNAGSLEKDLLARYGSPTAEALVESALDEARILEDEDFLDIKISVKHSSPRVMIQAYRMLAEKCDYPLHLGVTEAGPMPIGGVKSAVGIGTLLAEGIGDTIRVSLTDDPVEEVKIGIEILKSLGLRKAGLDLVACPSCGRAEVDVLGLTKQVNEALLAKGITVPIRVAVMGCVVNGPGEAREADLGIAAGKGQGFLIVKGEVKGKVPEERFVEALVEEAERIAESPPRTSPDGGCLPFRRAPGLRFAFLPVRRARRRRSGLPRGSAEGGGRCDCPTRSRPAHRRGPALTRRPGTSSTTISPVGRSCAEPRGPPEPPWERTSSARCLPEPPFPEVGPPGRSLAASRPHRVPCSTCSSPGPGPSHP